MEITTKTVRRTVSVKHNITEHQPSIADQPKIDWVCPRAKKRAGGWLGDVLVALWLAKAMSLLLDLGGWSHAGDACKTSAILCRTCIVFLSLSVAFHFLFEDRHVTKQHSVAARNVVLSLSGSERYTAALCSSPRGGSFSLRIRSLHSSTAALCRNSQCGCRAAASRALFFFSLSAAVHFIFRNQSATTQHSVAAGNALAMLVACVNQRSTLL